MASHSENERQRETDRKRERGQKERDKEGRERKKRECLGMKCLLSASKAASKICTKCLPSKSSKCEKNERQRKPFFVQLKRSARSFLTKASSVKIRDKLINGHEEK